MKKLIVLICLLLPVFSKATCIIIYLKGNDIYIAADSRRNYSIFKNGKLTSNIFQTVCKIHNVGNVFYAIAGHDDGGLMSVSTKSLKKFVAVDSD
ncbi:hypothetical protein [Mucilaginibacter gilvus]|uniref:Uncharacterized protein n=1 Tax=Mucilaginibacter gilvus TaxID=2305909 RepID=A0A3S3UYC5_9SPHI|nr:hypothetical protein [Mucilaginibacter gilvus]RWY57523.1 hypothetical protein EPL05_03060 [Mucilaginibacter gilvus]